MGKPTIAKANGLNLASAYDYVKEKISGEVNGVGNVARASLKDVFADGSKVVASQAIGDVSSVNPLKGNVDSAYKLTIVSQNKADGDSAQTLIIDAYLPEQVSMDLASTFNAPFDTRSLFGDKVKALAAFGGTPGMSKYMSMNVYEGTSHIQMNLPLQLVSYESPSDSYSCVDKLYYLSTLVLPSQGENDALLKSPGPKIKLDPDANTLFDTLGSIFTEPLPALKDENGNPIPNGGSAVQSTAASASSAVTKVAAAIKSQFTQAGQISVYLGNWLYFDSVVVESVSPTAYSMFDGNGEPIRMDINLSFKTVMIPTIQDMKRYLKRG